MFVLIFGRDGFFGKFDHYTELAHSESLTEIASKRVASGDLVFNQKTREIVQDDTWLFDWEKKDPNCYARRKMESKATF